MKYHILNEENEKLLSKLFEQRQNVNEYKRLLETHLNLYSKLIEEHLNAPLPIDNPEMMDESKKELFPLTLTNLFVNDNKHFYYDLKKIKDLILAMKHEIDK